jgi:Skp family chaperone for outer membrane proteins
VSSIQKDAEVMSPADQPCRQKEIEDKQIELRVPGNKLQKAVNDRRQELGQQMAPKLEAVLKELTELEGYDVIIERGSLCCTPTRSTTSPARSPRS